ncbi:hypothetical protein VTK56DRAFT_9459 [Thermocarpiscus australiensis]
MASLISCLNPVPVLPEYTGPYKVGTVDVEIPISELVPPSPTPEGAADVHTVLFRIFYPASPDSKGKRISWLPAPQRLHISAYWQFLGIAPTLASILSFLPRYLHWTSIPAHKNATLLPPPSDRPGLRWPTMIFSHGLGGNRNAYSHLAGSLASYGVVVICPEHRDGSAALTLVRDPKSRDEVSLKTTRHMVPYLRIPHDQTHEVWEARNKQLRIRLWELGLILEAISGIDRGEETILKSNLNRSTPESALSQFADKLDILDPGKVIFSGHSFGAATVVQLLKSTYYANHPSISAMITPLFSPCSTSAIAKQITPKNPAILLDMWCFPLLSASTAALYNLPLPCYDTSSTATSSTSTPSSSIFPPGGTAILAIESSHFVTWSEQLHATARILSPPPPSSSSAKRGGAADAAMRTVTADAFSSSEGTMIARPHFFYVEDSAHLGQSDFGLLFPWLTRRLARSDAPPARVLRLNVRAVLQFLRGNGVAVAGTAMADLVEGGVVKADDGCEVDEYGGVMEDAAILERDTAVDGKGKGKGKVEAWRWIDVVGLGTDAYPSELELAEGGRESREVRAEEGEKEMEGEIEPSLESVAEGAAAQAAREAVGEE